LLLFPEKEEYYDNDCVSGGTPPDPQSRLRRGLDKSQDFCEADLNSFCFLFLEKEEYYDNDCVSGGTARPQIPRVGFAEV
jgi:hypothetical protein